MKTLDYVLLALVIIGAINWGLIGFLQFDLVRMLFGGYDNPFPHYLCSCRIKRPVRN